MNGDNEKLSSREISDLSDHVRSDMFIKFICKLDERTQDANNNVSHLSGPLVSGSNNRSSAKYLWDFIVCPLIPERPALSNYHDFWGKLCYRSNWSRTLVNDVLASLNVDYRLSVRDSYRLSEREDIKTKNDLSVKDIFGHNNIRDTSQQEKDFISKRETINARRQPVPDSKPISNNDPLTDKERQEIGMCVHSDDFTRLLGELDAYDIWTQIQPDRYPSLENRMTFWKLYQELCGPIDRKFINKSLQRAYCEFRVKEV